MEQTKLFLYKKRHFLREKSKKCQNNVTGRMFAGKTLGDKEQSVTDCLMSVIDCFPSVTDCSQCVTDCFPFSHGLLPVNR
jgi:hypothetical protein